MQLTVCQKSYALAMRIFEISRIRRFFCSVPVNLRKAWAQRRYGAHCVGKLTDGVGEANETDTSFAFARGCGYISDEPHSELSKRNTEIGKMPGTMTSKPELRSQKLPVCSRQAGQRFTQFRCFTQPAKCMKFVNFFTISRFS